MSKLLNTNAKLDKNAGKAAQYLITGLTLAPHALSGHQVCEGSTIGCRAACNLWFAGQRILQAARAKAIRDTKALFADRSEFLARLHREIVNHVRNAERLQLTPLVRLNVASDLDWTEVIQRFPQVQFYDYTKIRSRFERYLDGQLPRNYALIFSASELSHRSTLDMYLRSGGNVAMVFNVDYYPAVKRIGALPANVRLAGRYWPVIDGDKHDVRLPAIDGRGVVVGLRLKGTNAAKARGRASGFAK